MCDFLRGACYLSSMVNLEEARRERNANDFHLSLMRVKPYSCETVTISDRRLKVC